MYIIVNLIYVYDVIKLYTYITNYIKIVVSCVRLIEIFPQSANSMYFKDCDIIYFEWDSGSKLEVIFVSKGYLVVSTRVQF